MRACVSWTNAAGFGARSPGRAAVLTQVASWYVAFVQVVHRRVVGGCSSSRESGVMTLELVCV